MIMGGDWLGRLLAPGQWYAVGAHGRMGHRLLNRWVFASAPRLCAEAAVCTPVCMIPGWGRGNIGKHLR